MIVDIVDKYRTDDNNPIKNLHLKNQTLINLETFRLKESHSGT